MASRSDGPGSSQAIFTYHHLCSQFVLASTHVLSSLPRRAPPALDQAIILPLGSTSSKTDEAEAGEEEDEYGYSVLLSTVYDKKPVMIRRDDGFEKRSHFRCVRCRVMLGYELDKTHFALDEPNSARIGKIVYLFPDALMTTEEMDAGKRFTEQEVLLSHKA